MSGNNNNNIISIPDDDDDFVEDETFLAELDAIEAKAVSLSSSSSKRRRTTLPDTDTPTPEGAYTAALKGSRSLTWQSQTSTTHVTKPSVVAVGGGGGGGGGACFKCGVEGHWARDCVASVTGAVAGTGTGIAGDEAVKACACGLGSCLVLTANTERNRGRKFFRCPVRQENGGCGFFEWCDQSSGDRTSAQERPWNSGNQQGMYQQPVNKGTAGVTRSWDEFSEGTSTPKSGYGAPPKYESADNKGYGVKAGSSCFKCAEEGHWARDCPTTSSSTMSTGVRDNSSSGGCYKCGQSGHWAKDCSQAARVRYH